MQFSAQDLMEKIIELRIQLDYQIVELPLDQIEDSIQYNAKELITTFEQLKYYYPEEFEQFLDFNPKYKPLDVISKDNSEGLQHIISCVTEDKEQTVASIVKQVQTHSFHQWVKKNSKAEIASVCETESDQAVYIHMSQFNLPQVKQEEIGDCIALAFTGLLSDNHELFQNPNIAEFRKQALLRKLMVDNRKYIYWDFKSLTVEDQTEQYSQRKTLYRPRGIAARKMIDSTYTDGKHLYSVISTTNTDTSSQGSQAFEIYKTLQTNFERNQLDLDLDKNLTPSVILFNNAFFCTENADKVQHYVGTSDELKPGYHHNNLRHKFDNLFDKPLGKNALDKINGLVTLSMIGNKELSWPRFPHTFDICDIIHCNPITAGADTLWLHTRFEQLKIYNNPQRTQKFFNFLLDYSNDVMDSLLKITPNAQEAIVADIKNSYERLIAGITRNFSPYNLQRPLTDDEIKKLNLLEEKIEEFNINQPNQTIDSNLSIALTPGSFEQQGKKLTRIIEKREEKFTLIAKQEKEEKEQIIQKIEEAILSSEKLFDQENIFKKLDNIAYEVYKGNGSGKVVEISEFLLNIQKNLQLAEIHNCDYFNIPQEANPNYNYKYSFLSQSGQTRKNFLNKLDDIMQNNSELGLAFENADTYIKTFLNQFHTNEGRKQIIENGGLVASVEQLCKLLEEPFAIIRSNSVKRYEEYKESTPFNDIDHKQLGAYWNVQVEKAVKHDNFDGMVAIIHEYLHRIEDKYKFKEPVSGKSLSDLPKKISVLNEMGKHHEHIKEAVNVLISRYNYLGELFDQQNKDKKKYKPKHYRIS